jgi:hypothetical protein
MNDDHHSDLDSPTTRAAIDAAYELLRASIVHYRGKPVGTVAAFHPELPAANYAECFVRDFVPGALVFLHDGEPEIVEHFLRTVLAASFSQRSMAGYDLVLGVMPASFKIIEESPGHETIKSDFGDRAIGRVAPVDSVMWWVALLHRYVALTGHQALAHEPEFQEGLRAILRLLLRDTFEVYPTLLTPDACFMIDRRMGVYGHPLEIQSLFYGVLRFLPDLLVANDENAPLIELARKREQLLRDYVRRYYWLDLARLNQIHRYATDEFGHEARNPLNVFPESIPHWVGDWMPDEGGYLAGNIGPGRLDFRFFALGNLLAVAFGLATDEEAHDIFKLYEARWDDLVGAMPIKICYPALEGEQWREITGCDAKNVPWSYHNGGSWPCLLWAFVAAALLSGRRDLARRAFEIALRRLPADGWPEYYDGRRGRLVGRRASFNQVWSASSLILAHRMLSGPRRASREFREDFAGRDGAEAGDTSEAP